MSKTKRFLAALCVTLLGTIGALTIATPAHAGSPCYSGQLCTYWNISAGDPMYYYTTGQWTCLNIGAPWTNNISSIYNRRGFTITLWDYPGCSSDGLYVTLGNGTYIGDLSYPDFMNDKGSSISFGW